MRSKRDCSTRQEFGFDRHDVIPGTSLRSRRGGSNGDETYQLCVMDTASGSPAAGRRLTFGTENCLGTGCYGASDPTAGATLAGLAPNVVTDATNSYGIAADDFQFPVFGQLFLVTLNGGSDPSLTTKLESLNESGPVVHFFTIGLDPALDNPSHTLTLSINEGGDGGDGFAVDFLTLGVETASATTPEPSGIVMSGMVLGVISIALWLRRRRTV